MLNKRGELTTQEILEIILAAGAVFVMAFLLFRLIDPNFDETTETAEGYFDTFLKEVGVADSGGVGVFSMWQPEEKVNYYLVYFGSGRRVSKRDIDFLASGTSGDNKFCLCLLEDEDVICDKCGDLSHPISYDELVVGNQEKIQIKKEGDVYVVTKV